jgi:hypothetical protein
MNLIEALPRLSVGDVDQNFSRLNLSAKSQLLRDKIKLLRQGSKIPQEMLHQIENHLNAISQEPSLIGQWNRYELAYEEFISAGSFEDLVSASLGIQVSGPELWERLYSST